jgi:hypothetical protein
MAKVGSKSWHEAKIREIEAASRKGGTKTGKKKKEAASKKLVTLKVVNKKPQPRYRSRVEYDFLMYSRIIFKWATENNPDLTRGEIEFLLYLYGVGAFTKSQFHDYHRLIGLYSLKSLQKFQDDGWIKLWRPKSGKETAIYVLTNKSKILCGKMHKFACGVEEIPTDPKVNKVAETEEKRINNYYLDAIKKMNKNKAPTKK